MANSISSDIIVLDTSRRDTSTYIDTNEYSMYLGNSYNGVISIDLVHAAIPQTESTISARTNILMYSVGGGQRRTVTIPPGTYTPSSLVSELNTQMTAHGDGMSVTYSTTTRKVTFSAGTSFVIYAMESTCRRVLGIVSNAYTVQSVLNAYTPDGIVDLSGPKCIRITSPDLETGTLGIIDLQQTPQQFVQFPSRPFRTMKSKVSTVRILLTTDGDRPYETGCTDHTLVLRISYLDTQTTTIRPRFQQLP
jgi:hypothetical protein